MKINISDKKSLVFLDGLRGLAALYVAIGHARWLLWEGYSEFSLSYHSAPFKFSMFHLIQVYFYSIFRYGHQAVLFFFILSGFLIHLKYAKAIKENPNSSFDLKDYMFRRIKRIYPPLLFALVLTFALDSMGLKLFGFNEIYTGLTNYPLINENIIANHSLNYLVGNLFFLMPMYVQVYGTNGPLWSLGYEWWFYVLYPLFWYLSKRSIFLALSTMLILFALSFLSFPFPLNLLFNIFSLMLSWWFGALLADVYVGRLKISNKILISFVIFLIPGVFNLFHNDIVSDTLTALGFIGVVSICFFLQDRMVSLVFLEKLKWLGDCSFSLYVTHFPILVLISGGLIHYNHKLPSTFTAFYIGLFIVLFFAWVIHFVIEKPFVKRRKAII